MAKCAFCDASFETSADDVLLVCPYCGTAQTVSGNKLKNHYMIRVYHPVAEAQKILIDWCSKQLGVPQDLPVKAKFVKSHLVFYPFWISRVDADSSYNGLGKDARFYDPWPQRPGAYKRIEFFYKPESGRFVRRHEINIPGISGMHKAIKEFPIPSRAKEFFSHAHAEEHGGTVLHSKIDEAQAITIARQTALERQTALIMSEVVKIESRNDKIDVGETFLIHVPVWHLDYKYGARTYKAVVSAATGYVIESEYPRSLALRAAAITFGCIFSLVGLVLLLLANTVGVLVGAGNVSGSMLFVIGMIMLYKGVSRRAAREKI